MEYTKKKYCVVFVGDTEGVKQDVESVSMGEKVGYVEASGLLITTFYSIFLSGELVEYFNLPNEDLGEISRNFIITDLTKDGADSVIEFKNPTLQTILQVFDDEALGGIDVDSLSTEEKEQMIDDILNKGSVISNEDRITLDLLTSSLKK